MKVGCVITNAMPSPLARRLAIPFASLIPIGAIIFAFALGPSPERYVADFVAHDGSPAARRVLLEKAGPRAVPALVRRIVQPSMRHRAEAIAYLGDVRARPAVEALRRIAGSLDEAPDIRARAADAAAAIERSGGLSSVGAP